MATKNTSTTRRKRPAKAATKSRAKAPQNRNRTGGAATGDRGTDGRFAPGNRANPGGRPKADQRVIDLARERTDLAIQTLAEIAGDKKASKPARVSAAIALLDRGWGRPRQALEHSGPDGADLPTGITVTLVKPDEGDE